MATTDLYSQYMNPMTPEIMGLERQRQYARMLMQQSAQPQGQMVSGQFVAPSWAQQLNAALNPVIGAYLTRGADEQALKLAEQLRKGRSESEERIISNLLPRTEMVEMAGPAYQGQIPTMQRDVSPNYAEALREIRTNPYGAGKEYVPAILKNMIPEPVKPTSDMQNYEFAKSTGFKGSFNDFKNQVSPIERERLALDREKFEFDKQTKGSGKDLTESQGKASAFQSQMVSANNVVKNLEAQGFNPTSFASQTAVRLAGGVANPVIPVTAQQYKQAQDQWSEAYLRFKTGAAATEQEVQRNNRTFFPVLGDKPDQIAQKAAAREQAERDIGIAAGRGAGLGAQPIAGQANAQAPAGLPSQSAIDAELKRRGLK